MILIVKPCGVEDDPQWNWIRISMLGTWDLNHDYFIFSLKRFLWDVVPEDWNSNWVLERVKNKVQTPRFERLYFTFYYHEKNADIIKDPASNKNLLRKFL